MRRWRVITTVDINKIDFEGNPQVIPKGTSINEILWDGVTQFTPPENTILEEIEDA